MTTQNLILFYFLFQQSLFFFWYFSRLEFLTHTQATFFQIHEEYKRDNSPTFSESGQGQDFAHEVDAIPDEDIVLSRSTPLLSSSVDIFSHRKVRRSPPPLPTEEEDKANDSI